MPADTEQFFPTAVKAAKEAGKLLMAYYNRLEPDDIQKKGPSDYVTKVDRLAEELIIGIIREDFPDHQILAEESSSSSSSSLNPHSSSLSPYRWIVDPLDGTTNYLHGFPMFSVSIGLAKQDDMIIGIVLDPIRDEMFWSQKGMGTWINRDQVRVSGEAHLEEALVATGFPFRHKAVLSLYLTSFERVFQRCGGIRRAGSAALDMAYVASSRADGFWEYGLSPWDIAAGSLLITEAGGTVSDFFGKPGYMQSGNIVGGTPHVHAELVKITADVYASMH